MRRVAEFIGGPLDGERREVQSGLGFRLTLCGVEPVTSSLAPERFNPTVPIYYGFYEWRTSTIDGQHYLVWQGYQ